MNNKMKNSLVLISIFSLQVLCLTLKLTEDAEEDAGHIDTMWHPHLRRDWIDDQNFKIVDKKRNFEENFPIFLEIKKSIKEKETANNVISNFVFDPSGKNKMNCVCKFVKENSEFVSNEKKELNISPLPRNKQSGKMKKFYRNEVEITNKPNNVVNLNHAIINSNLTDKKDKGKNLNFNNSQFSREKSNLKDNSNTKNSSLDHDFRNKYMNLLGDIRNVDGKERNFQEVKAENFDNENKLKKQNFLNQANIEEFERSVQTNINNLNDSNNYQQNKSNNSNPNLKENGFLDLSQYRLKQINNNSNFFNTNELELTNKKNFSENKNNFLKKKFNISDNQLDNSFKIQNQIPFNVLNFNSNEENKKILGNNLISDFSNTNRINFVQNQNQHEQQIYKNILEYLSYNNSMMQNIQNFLLSNSNMLGNTFFNNFQNQPNLSNLLMKSNFPKVNQINNNLSNLENNLKNVNNFYNEQNNQANIDMNNKIFENSNSQSKILGQTINNILGNGYLGVNSDFQPKNIIQKGNEEFDLNSFFDKGWMNSEDHNTIRQPII